MEKRQRSPLESITHAQAIILILHLVHGILIVHELFPTTQGFEAVVTLLDITFSKLSDICLLIALATSIGSSILSGDQEDKRQSSASLVLASINFIIDRAQLW